MQTAKENFLQTIDNAISIAKTTENSEPLIKEQINNLIKVLKQLKRDTLNDALEPSPGRVTLGLSRNVADWIEPFDSPLLKAVGDIEKYYQQQF